MQNVKRGECYFIMKGDAVMGSEQESGRPAIIVSNDFLNETSPVVEVVYLTTQPKKDMPTHVKVWATSVESTALCEQVFTVSKERIGQYSGTCAKSEIEAINEAIAKSLGLAYEPKQETVNVYEKLYNELIEKLIKR